METPANTQRFAALGAALTLFAAGASWLVERVVASVLHAAVFVGVGLFLVVGAVVALPLLAVAGSSDEASTDAA